MSAILAISLLTLVLFIPLFLLYTSRWTVDPSTNVTIAVLSYRPNFPFPPEIVRNIIAIVIGVFNPTAVVIVTVSSVLVVVKLGAAMKTRKQMTNSEGQTHADQSETKITKMLLSVCFLFIILMLPETTVNLVNYFVPEFGLRGCYHNTFEIFVRVVSLASCLNSSVNFIAYVSLSAKFRETASQILKCHAVSRTTMSKAGVSTTSVRYLDDT